MCGRAHLCVTNILYQEGDSQLSGALRFGISFCRLSNEVKGKIGACDKMMFRVVLQYSQKKTEII